MGDIREKTRAARIAQAQAAIVRARDYTSRRPSADATPVIRNMIEVANGLITELKGDKT